MASTGEPRETRGLDGIRGLSALAVAVFHAVLFTGHSGDVERELPLLYRLVMHGDLGVTVFIVLSGYVLMLQVRDGRLPDLRRFARRRARRILPPYFAALALSLLLIAAVPAMQTPNGTRWDDKVPVTWESVVAHVLLVQDVSSSWLYGINGPLWSVAVEWHIYALMPLLLLPLWRLVGSKATVAVTVGGTVAAHSLGWLGGYPKPWLLGMFTLGMFAAQATRSARSGAVAGWLGGTTVTLLLAAPWWAVRHAALTDVLAGVSVAALLVWMSGRPPWRALASGPVNRLGLMSYSVYLIHSPLLAAGNIALLRLGLPTAAHLGAMLFAVLPASLVCAWLFYCTVERRFTTSHQSRVLCDSENRQSSPRSDRQSRTGILVDRHLDVVTRRQHVDPLRVGRTRH